MKKKRNLSSINQIDSIIINDKNDRENCKEKDKDKKISKPIKMKFLTKWKKLK